MPFIDNGSAHLFYTAHGTPGGPVIVLLHGWACDGHDWSHQIPLLISLGFLVIALDLRGHGRSSVPASMSDYAMKALADDVVALVRDVRTGPVIVIAHSMGTIVASILACEHPEVVKAMVLAHPIYCGTPPALAIMSETMRKNPGAAPDMVARFFESHMYTAQTPEWVKTWHIRRVLGMDGIALAGCGQAIVDLFGDVIGQTEKTKAFMKKRRAPRLVVATNALPAAAAWEEELGLGHLDKCCTLNEGTFSHFVDSGKFNEILKEWLMQGNFVVR